MKEGVVRLAEFYECSAINNRCSTALESWKRAYLCLLFHMPCKGPVLTRLLRSFKNKLLMTIC